MDFIITLMILILAVWLDRRMKRIEAELKRNAQAFNLSFRSRQRSLAQQRVSEKDPDVDFKPRTTRRDSDDIPLTGRMSKLPRLSREGMDNAEQAPQQ